MLTKIPTQILKHFNKYLLGAKLFYRSTFCNLCSVLVNISIKKKKHQKDL